MKQTKIVATIGLQSESEEILLDLMERGMNVARLNFSHGTHEWHKEAIRKIRAASEKHGTHIGILADLQGPRIRTYVQEDVTVTSGEAVIITDVSSDFQTEQKTIGLDCPGILGNFAPGHRILIEDGIMQLEIEENLGNHAIARVIDGGVVRNRKGVNVPETSVPLPSLTEKDLKDLEFSLSEHVDFVAISFVRSKDDVRQLREHMKRILGENARLPHIVSKIERKEAIDSLNEILQETDVVMVARGDLGIETKASRVAILQKEIIAKCLRHARPVIVATQMLDSMIRNPRPTRAEVSDVTNAVIDHADAVMLSGESASGGYPREAVAMMRDIIQDTEQSVLDNVTNTLEIDLDTQEVAIAKAAQAIARDTSVSALLLFTHSGFTARVISHFRCEKPIYVATDMSSTAKQLSVVWGVQQSFVTEHGIAPYDALASVANTLKEAKKLNQGDKVAVVLGTIPGVGRVRLAGLLEIG